jgi:uncharacterized membrane protein HdeD (DUF308 family)
MNFVENRKALALRGLAGVVFGLVAFFLPGITLAMLVLVFGMYSFIDGVFAIAAAAHPRLHSRPTLLLIEGAVGIGVGVASVLWTGMTALMLVAFVAFWAIFTGALELVIASRMDREIPGRRYLWVTGAVSIAFGGLVLLWPSAGALAIVLLLGMYALTFGTTLLVLAWRLHQVAQGSDEFRNHHPRHRTA